MERDRGTKVKCHAHRGKRTEGESTQPPWTYGRRLGTQNFKGINTTKSEVVVDIFKKRKVRIVCLDGDEIERGGRGIMVWS